MANLILQYLNLISNMVSSSAKFSSGGGCMGGL